MAVHTQRSEWKNTYTRTESLGLGSALSSPGVDRSDRGGDRICQHLCDTKDSRRVLTIARGHHASPCGGVQEPRCQPWSPPLGTGHLREQQSDKRECLQMHGGFALP